jgi:glycosyltransferase involved in cell wall biosynthesis
VRIFINGLSLSNTYGIGRYTGALLQGLERVDRRGFEIDVYLRQGDEKPFKDSGVFKFVYPASSKPNRLFLEQIELPTILARIKPRVYFSPDFTLPTICKAKRRIVTVHDLLVYTNPESVSLRARVLYRSFLPRAMKSAHLIFVDSNDTRKRAMELFEGADIKAIVVYPALDRQFTEQVSPSANPPNDDTSAGGSKVKIDPQSWLSNKEIKRPFLLYVGSNSSRKNLQTLINRFAELKTSLNIPENLVLVGCDGSLNTPDHGIFDIGFQFDEVVMNLYKNAVGLCLISSEEGFGYPVAEALACGCPALITKNSAMSEISPDGKGVIEIDPSVDDDVRTGLIRLINENKRLRSEIDRKDIQKRFSAERLANEFLDYCAMPIS